MKLIKICVILFTLVIVNSQLFSTMQSSDKVSNNGNLESSLFNSIGEDEKLGNVRIVKKQDNKINVNQGVHKSIPKIEKIEKSKSEGASLSSYFEKPTKTPIIQNQVDNNKNANINKEIEPLNQIIDKHKKELFQIAQDENETLKIQKREITDLEKQFADIRQKTLYLERIISENDSMKEIKGKFEEHSKEWDKYSTRFSEINSNISNLVKDIHILIDKADQHEKRNQLMDKLSHIDIDNSEIQNNIHAENLSTQNLVSNEIKLDKTKLSDNFIELDNSLQINFNGEKYTVSEIMEFNKFLNKIRETCGDNLNCLMSLEEINQQKEKENLIENTIQTIKSHLDSLK